MNLHSPVIRILIPLALLIFLFSACEPQVAVVPPTATPFPTWTPTPTPGPEAMRVVELISRCEELSASGRQVIVEGALFLPSETIYGYTIEDALWLGLNLIEGNRITILVKVGQGQSSMEPLPNLFAEKDLIVHASDGGTILDRHRVRITGRPKYKADDPDRYCELFVDEIDSLEKPEVLVPRDITMQELLNNDRIDDCSDLEEANQLVRIRGWITVNEKDTVCSYGSCRTPFFDGSSRMMVKIANGGGANSIGGLDMSYQLSTVSLFDQDGRKANPADVTFIGQITGIPEYCLLTVYTILPAGSE